MKKLFACLVSWAIFSTQVFAESVFRNETVNTKGNHYLSYIDGIASEMSEEETKEWHAYLASVEDAVLELTEEEKQEYANLAENLVSKYSVMSEEEKQNYVKAAEEIMLNHQDGYGQHGPSHHNKPKPTWRWIVEGLLATGVIAFLVFVTILFLGIWWMEVNMVIAGLALMLGYGALTATGEDANALDRLVEKIESSLENYGKKTNLTKEDLIPVPLH